MKDLGKLFSFPEIKFDQTDSGIVMSQRHCLENILKSAGMENCKPRATPCEQNTSYDSNATCMSSMQYRQIVGSLVYAMTCTRPDLSHVIIKLSQHLLCHDAADWIKLKLVVRYIKHAIGNCYIFRMSATDLRLIAYFDADWASSATYHHSITGYCIRLVKLAHQLVGNPKSRSLLQCQLVKLNTCRCQLLAKRLYALPALLRN